MHKRFVYTCLFVLITLSSCTHFYAPALLNSDISYQPKPISQDSLRHANYVNALFTSGSGAEFGDDVTYGQLNLSRAYVFKNFNTSLGAYGFLGNYLSNHRIKNENDNFKRSFGGIGGRTSVNYFIATKRVNYRVIGIEAGYSKEYGSYTKFRKEAFGQPDFKINPSTAIFTAGISSEIIWHSEKSVHNQYGFRLFLGDTFTNEKYYDSSLTSNIENSINNLLSVSYFMQYQKFHFIAETAFLNTRFGLGYRF